MKTEITEESVEILSPSGTLEGVLAYPSNAMPNTVVLFLSPHPHLGGNMENNVVRHLGRGCAQLGHVTLRFNYHGVDRSTMPDTPHFSAREYWAEIEREQAYEKLLPDVRAASDMLQATISETRGMVVIGYSLGAVLAGLSSEIFPDATVIAIAPPIGRVELRGFNGYCSQKVFVTGGRDFSIDTDAFDDFFRALHEPKHHEQFTHSDHFFRRSEKNLLDALEPFLLPREVQDRS